MAGCSEAAGPTGSPATWTLLLSTVAVRKYGAISDQGLVFPKNSSWVLSQIAQHKKSPEPDRPLIRTDLTRGHGGRTNGLPSQLL